MLTPIKIDQVDFIEMLITAHQGRLNWTERKPKVMKYKKTFVFYYDSLFITLKLSMS